VVEQSELETIYREAQSALKGRDYVRAGELLRQILQVDENYKDTSRLLARVVKLRRQRWYNHPLVWGMLGLAALILLGIWIAPLVRGFYASQASVARSTNTSRLPVTQTQTEVSDPSKTPSPTPTSVPLAWKRISMGQEFARDEITAIAIDPKDVDVIYVGTTHAGIYKSIDGGISWRPFHNGLKDAHVLSILIDPNEPRIVYAGVASNQVYKTTNGGQDWQIASDGLHEGEDNWENGRLLMSR